MKLLTILLSAILFFTSCSKNEIITENAPCRKVMEFSDKYSGDSTFLKRDTIMIGGDNINFIVVCYEKLDELRKVVPVLTGCPSDGYQIFRYKIGNENCKPIIFKH